MGTSEKDWREEQRRVDRVIGEIERKIGDLRQNVGQVKTEIMHIRKNFWEDVTVNFEDAAETAETAASLRQQAEVLSERERIHRHARKQLFSLTRLRQSPWFGRIDFTEDGEEETERIYLGTASLVDESGEQYLVYDWRAPVSGLYYDYPPGPARYETPGGTISGTMKLKRQYIIRDGRMESMFDAGVTVGDELLQEVLGKQADSWMKSIVATIQKEQNRIIRDERSRLLIVQGAAGSGKTSAALQRVAYLLYRYRETLRAENIVLFSPNSLFNSYVSTVLPELGEENMVQTTFQEYLERQLGELFRLEDPFTQMEYTLASMDDPGYEARIEGIRYKAGTDFIQVMEYYIDSLGQGGLIFKDIRFRDRILVSEEEIRNQFYAQDPSLPIPERMERLSRRLLKRLKELARRERNRPWVVEEVQLLDPETQLRAYRKLQRESRFTEDTFDDFDREQQLLASMVVRERFKPLIAGVKRLDFLDVPAVYRQLYADPETVRPLIARAEIPAGWGAVCAQTLERLDRSELAYEDATPYLYLKERLEGFRTNHSVRHVFIDEAQDCSPFLFTFIRRLFPRSKMTVLGDPNQTIHAHAGSGTGFGHLAALFPAGETQSLLLNRSYRSTRPIVEFTRQLIDGGEMIEPFHREGRKPTLTRADSPAELASKIAARIRTLQEAGHRTIAVICKTARESREAYESLRQDNPVRLVEKETASFETGTLVLPAYLAKGVEFDAVVIHDASAARYGKESERKLLYTACTRAMHELHVVYAGEMSPLLSSVSPAAYDREESGIH